MEDSSEGDKRNQAVIAFSATFLHGRPQEQGGQVTRPSLCFGN